MGEHFVKRDWKVHEVRSWTCVRGEVVLGRSAATNGEPVSLKPLTVVR